MSPISFVHSATILVRFSTSFIFYWKLKSVPYLMNGRHWDPCLSLKEFGNWNTPTAQGRKRVGANIHYAGHFNSTSILCAQIWVSHLLAQPGAPDVQIQRSCKGSLTQSSPAILIIKLCISKKLYFYLPSVSSIILWVALRSSQVHTVIVPRDIVALYQENGLLSCQIVQRPQRMYFCGKPEKHAHLYGTEVVIGKENEELRIAFRKVYYGT